MKKIIATYLVFCSLAAAFSQVRIPVEESLHAAYRNDMPNKYLPKPPALYLPEKGDDAKEKAWKPLRISLYSEQNHAGLELEERHYYTYIDRRLHQIDVKRYNTAEADSVVFYYNRTGAPAEEDREDTVIYYQNGQKLLRLSYGHYQRDSLFLSTSIDLWSGGRWHEVEKNYKYYWDTVLWFNYKSLTYLYGELASGYIDTPEYDDAGNVARITAATYNTNTKQFDIKIKREYLYDEEGLCYQFDDYNYNKSNNTWKLSGSRRNMQWQEWHGFFEDGGIPLWIWALNLSPDLENKLSFSEDWNWNSGREELELFSVQKTGWDMGDSIHAIDTLWYFSNFLDTLYPVQVQECTVDPNGNYVLDASILWDDPDENGVQQIRYKSTRTTEYLYGPYGWYEYNYYRYVEYSEGEAVNTHYHDRYVVDAFLDDGTPLPFLKPEERRLSLFPNPAAGSVTLSSGENLVKADIFDLTGRLVRTVHIPATKTFSLDMGTLPKGLYLIRAQTGNNTFQTGKVVVP